MARLVAYCYTRLLTRLYRLPLSHHRHIELDSRQVHRSAPGTHLDRDCSSHCAHSIDHEAGAMKRASVRLSVCLSLCFIDRQQQRRAAGLMLSAPRTGDIDRLLNGAPAAGAPSYRRRAADAGAQQQLCQYYVDSQRARLNIDLVGWYEIPSPKTATDPATKRACVRQHGDTCTR